MYPYKQFCMSYGKMTLGGRASIRVRPDIANVNIGIATEGRELRVVQESNARLSLQVISALKRMGIEENDIQTQGYFISTEYDFIDGRQVFRAYRVTHNLNVTVRDIDRVGAVVDTAVASGANQIGGITFDIHNPTKYYRRALELAIEDAKEKAEILAKQNDTILCRTPISIKEETEATAVPQEVGLLKAAAPTPIQPGQMEITAVVKVDFMYK